MIYRSAQQHTLVDAPGVLAEVLRHIRKARRLAVDTEADSRHRYPEKVCLVQVATPERVYLLDTLAPLDLSPLGETLKDPRVEKVLHGADFDIRGLNRDFGFVFERIYDTNTAARFAGLERFGLAALIEDLLGLVIAKDQRLQRADWSRRPLSSGALDYAAADVAHLLRLRNALDRRVRALRRQEWVCEEFERLERVRYVPPDPETAFLSVKGAHLLNGKELVVLKELYTLREAEARRINRPTAYVMPAEAMIYLATHPEADLIEVPRLGPSVVRRLGRDIHRAVQRGIKAGSFRRPAPAFPLRAPPTPEQVARLSRLKVWRSKLGERLSMDPSLLWPMRSLERLAREPATFEEELRSPDVRRWQRREFGESLRAALFEPQR